MGISTRGDSKHPQQHGMNNNSYHYSSSTCNNSNSNKIQNKLARSRSLSSTPSDAAKSAQSAAKASIPPRGRSVISPNLAQESNRRKIKSHSVGMNSHMADRTNYRSNWNSNVIEDDEGNHHSHHRNNKSMPQHHMHKLPRHESSAERDTSIERIDNHRQSPSRGIRRTSDKVKRSSKNNNRGRSIDQKEMVISCHHSHNKPRQPQSDNDDDTFLTMSGVSEMTPDYHHRAKHKTNTSGSVLPSLRAPIKRRTMKMIVVGDEGVDKGKFLDGAIVTPDPKQRIRPDTSIQVRIIHPIAATAADSNKGTTTTSLLLMESILLQREDEMVCFAKKFGISKERWNGSLLHELYQTELTREKQQSNGISCVLGIEICLVSSVNKDEKSNSENNGSPIGRNVVSIPNVHKNANGYIQTLSEFYSPTTSQKPNKSATFSNSSNSSSSSLSLTSNAAIVRVPAWTQGNDILLLLEQCRIVYSPDQLVFDTFGAYMRTRLWSDYYSHRMSMAIYLQQRLAKLRVSKLNHLFATNISKERHRLYVGSKRCDFFEGGIRVATDTNKSVIKADGSVGSSTKGEATSCSIVYEFFNPPYDDGDESYDCDEKGDNEDDDKNSVDYSLMTANDNHRLDKLLRKDFCRFMEGNLGSGASVTFRILKVTTQPMDAASNEHNQRQQVNAQTIGWRAVLSIDLSGKSSGRNSRTRYRHDTSALKTENVEKKLLAVPEEEIYTSAICTKHNFVEDNCVKDNDISINGNIRNNENTVDPIDRNQKDDEASITSTMNDLQTVSNASTTDLSYGQACAMLLFGKDAVTTTPTTHNNNVVNKKKNQNLITNKWIIDDNVVSNDALKFIKDGYDSAVLGWTHLRNSAEMCQFGAVGGNSKFGHDNNNKTTNSDYTSDIVDCDTSICSVAGNNNNASRKNGKEYPTPYFCTDNVSPLDDMNAQWLRNTFSLNSFFFDTEPTSDFSLRGIRADDEGLNNSSVHPPSSSEKRAQHLAEEAHERRCALARLEKKAAARESTKQKQLDEMVELERLKRMAMICEAKMQSTQQDHNGTEKNRRNEYARHHQQSSSILSSSHSLVEIGIGDNDVEMLMPPMAQQQVQHNDNYVQQQEEDIIPAQKFLKTLGATDKVQHYSKQISNENLLLLEQKEKLYIITPQKQHEVYNELKDEIVFDNDDDTSFVSLSSSTSSDDSCPPQWGESLKRRKNPMNSFEDDDTIGEEYGLEVQHK
mmetsp:Transcript_21366/g.26169  ORF Transcript_21366/g.26169 Transcript_21366/m.26169 type:complete len:1223 (+) Transcript_21366:78-3746(+)